MIKIVENKYPSTIKFDGYLLLFENSQIVCEFYKA